MNDADPSITTKTLAEKLAAKRLSIWLLAPVLVAFAEPTPPIQQNGDDLAARKKAMVGEQITSRGIHDQPILTAMETVPRHRFIPPSGQKTAYGDHPVAIGYGPTISQPYIVAYMCQLARLWPESRVLEVGTGSGYHAAVMAQIADTVYTMEIIPELAARSRETLTSLGYANLVTRNADGYPGGVEPGLQGGGIAGDRVLPAGSGHLRPQGGFPAADGHSRWGWGGPGTGSVSMVMALRKPYVMARHRY